MTKKITEEEWIAIAGKSKEIDEKLIELSVLLSGKLPHAVYLNKLNSATKSFGILRSHLDDICNQNCSEDKVHFYGSSRKE